VAALAWMAVIVRTYLLARPSGLRTGQRVLGAGVVAVLCLTVAAPLGFGAELANSQRQLLERLFPALSGGTPADEAIGKARLNVLLVGSDAGPDRRGTRTDTMMVASVDTRTGRTILFWSSVGLMASSVILLFMPAVFETAELIRSAGWMRRLSDGPRLGPSPPVLLAMVCMGLTMLVLSMIWPTYFYPFLWGSVFFLVEPINAWRERPSLLGYLSSGNWRPIVALGLGALVCGFFWELWNFYSYPKWTYTTPGVDFLHVFEMPLLGFVGYPAFGLELYALMCLIAPRPPHLRL